MDEFRARAAQRILDHLAELAAIEAEEREEMGEEDEREPLATGKKAEDKMKGHDWRKKIVRAWAPSDSTPPPSLVHRYRCCCFWRCLRHPLPFSLSLSLLP